MRLKEKMMLMNEMRVKYGEESIKTTNIKSSTDRTNPDVPIIKYGKIIMVNPDQLWFWSDEWQAGERRVDEYIRSGNVQEFDTMEDFLRSLRE